MRLINCSTLQLEEFFGSAIPPYAILSHTWGDDEVTFADVPFDESTKARKGYRKIEFTCKQTSRDGLNYAWVDTCCIDKSSSSELSEAINSMFNWYRNSDYCYAYLSDVQEADMSRSFSESRWFKRGWTLQELVAPKEVIFYDREWSHIGKRSDHVDWISGITGIDPEVLDKPPESNGGDDEDDRMAALSSACVAKRLSWASRRETTRLEDIAYCLLGIFDVNMPLLYGEGDRAFLRLQEEIIARTDDDSILAWGLEPEMDHPQGLVSDTVKSQMAEYFNERTLLASSPKDFMHCANLKYTSVASSPFTLTNVGLQIRLPLVSVYQPDDEIVSKAGGGWIGLLRCSSGKSQEFLGIPLVPAAGDIQAVARQMEEPLGSQTDEAVIQQMSRVQIMKRMNPVVTLVVGPRAAVKSVPGTIIISRYGSEDWETEYHSGDQQFIVNESKTLQELGYRIKFVTRFNITQWNGEVHGCDLIWSPETRVLTMEDHYTRGELIEFGFEIPGDELNSRFAIFVRPANSGATVRKGATFSKYEKRTICHHLRKQEKQDDADAITIFGNEGRSFKVSARVNKTEVYLHRIFEVNVEAIQDLTRTVYYSC
jgi:hypothetical protein